MIDDAELEQYARESLPQFQLDELAGGIDSGLVARVDEHLRLSLRRINDVPADDPFWSRTNRRPTLFKAQDWFRQRLDRNPGDHEARWVVLSYTLAWSQYGAEDLLRPLVREDVHNVRWLVGASEWLTVTSGPDQSDALRAALRSSTGEASLQVLLITGAPPERRAARVALAVLEGASLPGRSRTQVRVHPCDTGRAPLAGADDFTRSVQAIRSRPTRGCTPPEDRVPPSRRQP